MVRGNLLFYAHLWGGHPTLPISELKALLELQLNYEDRYRIVDIVDNLAFFQADLNPDSIKELVERAAYVKSVGLYLGVCEVEDSKVNTLDCNLEFTQLLDKNYAYKVDFHRIKGYLKEVDSRKVIVGVARILEEAGFKATPKGTKVVDAIAIGGSIVLGLRLASLNVREFEERKPSRRPFFKPGPLDPRLSRVLVNISRFRPGEVILDPFCGTGGIVLEACILGASRILCGDIDKAMTIGSKVNLSHYKCPATLSYCADATNPPIKDDSIDRIVTDPPYGRSTTTLGRPLASLYEKFVEKAFNLLRRGGYLVFAGPEKLRPQRIASNIGFKVVEKHYMYVHGSLTRIIVVARKP